MEHFCVILNHLILFSKVHTGVTGFVTDKHNEEGIENALIHVNQGEKHDKNKVIKTANDGDYWRLLVAGRYTITASAKG